MLASLIYIYIYIYIFGFVTVFPVPLLSSIFHRIQLAILARATAAPIAYNAPSRPFESATEAEAFRQPCGAPACTAQRWISQHWVVSEGALRKDSYRAYYHH